MSPLPLKPHVEIIKMLSNNSTPIPLFSVSLLCEARGAVQTIQLSQRFLNPSLSPIECLFRLPTPYPSVLHDLTITTDDGRVLKAQLEDKDKAKERYSDAISSGNTAVLGEESDKEELKLNIGNLGPGMGLEVTVRLVAPLQCEGNRWLVTIPAWLIPDWAQEIMPYGDFAALNVAERREKLAVDVSLSQLYPILDVLSASNTFTTAFSPDRLQASIRLLSLTKSQDIQFTFQTEESIKPIVRVQRSALGEYTGLLSFIPPLLSSNQSVSDLESRGDFVLIIDRSGSMSGNSINMAKEAAIFFLKSLSEGSFFNVVSFGSSHSKLFPASVPVSSPNITQAITLLSEFSADMGGTNILNPLEAVYAEMENSALPRSLYMLTDGEVEDRDSVIACISRHSKQVRVHAFGIGSGVDRNLILQAAEAAKGCAEFISNPADIKKKVISVLKKALLPALSALQVQWTPVVPEQYPSNGYLPVCYFGELIHVFAHFGSQLPSGQANLNAINTVTGENVTFQVSLEGGKEEEGAELSLLWARAAIYELTTAHTNDKSSVNPDRIKELSKKYGVPSKFTAYICEQANAEGVAGQMQVVSVAMPPARRHSGQQYGGGGIALCCMAMPDSWGDALCAEYEECEDMPEDRELCCLAPPTFQDFSYQREALDDQIPLSAPAYASIPPAYSPTYPAFSPISPANQPTPVPFSSSALTASLVDLVSLQEVSGLWLSTNFSDLLVKCPLPEEVAALGAQAQDLWTTLCVLVILIIKFAQEAEEWEVIARKANRVLRAGSIDQVRYLALIQAKLGL
jgi:hypothetical protein